MRDRCNLQTGWSRLRTRIFENREIWIKWKLLACLATVYLAYLRCSMEMDNCKFNASEAAADITNAML